METSQIQRPDPGATVDQLFDHLDALMRERRKRVLGAIDAEAAAAKAKLDALAKRRATILGKQVCWCGADIINGHHCENGHMPYRVRQ